MSKIKTILGTAVVFAAAAALGYLVNFETSASLPPVGAPEPTAAWASDAMNPTELVREADLVVRVQVVDQDDAYAVTPAPFRDPRAVAELQALGRQVPRLLFTPSHLEILEVYDGAAQAGDRVKVLQTGGELGGERSELLDDPLYRVGTEHVLFLRDLATEGPQAGGEATFVTVNPAGRYEVEGEQVLAQTTFFGADPEAAATDLGELEAEIRAAVAADDEEPKPGA